MHCSLCEGENVFTILNGNSLCHHCYLQMEKAKEFEDERRETIIEIRDMVKEILKKLDNMDKA